MRQPDSPGAATGLLVLARAAARLVDTLLCATAIGIVFRRTWEDLEPETVLFVAGLYGSAVLGSLLLPVIGATPGKLLFGIRVCRRDGGKPSLRQAFAREGAWIVEGIWLAAGPLMLIPAARAIVGLGRGTQARWDARQGLRTQFRETASALPAPADLWMSAARVLLLVPMVLAEAWLLLWLALASWALAWQPQEVAWAAVRSLVTAPAAVAATARHAILNSASRRLTVSQCLKARCVESNMKLARTLERDYQVSRIDALLAVCPDTRTCGGRLVSYSEASRRLELAGARRRRPSPFTRFWQKLSELWKEFVEGEKEKKKETTD